MKENGSFRILVITKKELKNRQALYRIFLKAHDTKYTEVPQSSISMHPFLMFPLFQKYLNPQQMVNSVVYHPCPSRVAPRITLTFIRYLTLININLIKQKKKALSFE